MSILSSMINKSIVDKFITVEVGDDFTRANLVNNFHNLDTENLNQIQFAASWIVEAFDEIRNDTLFDSVTIYNTTPEDNIYLVTLMAFKKDNNVSIEISVGLRIIISIENFKGLSNLLKALGDTENNSLSVMLITQMLIDLNRVKVINLFTGEEIN